MSFCRPEETLSNLLPFFRESVAAGFPSPAQHEMEKRCSLNELLIKHPSATFFASMNDASMVNAGIFQGDLLIIDKSILPACGKILAVNLDGEFLIRRFVIQGKVMHLKSESFLHPTLLLTKDRELSFLGTVTCVIHLL